MYVVLFYFKILSFISRCFFGVEMPHEQRHVDLPVLHNFNKNIKSLCKKEMIFTVYNLK